MTMNINYITHRINLHAVSKVYGNELVITQLLVGLELWLFCDDDY